jgi:hypothetical protein
MLRSVHLNYELLFRTVKIENIPARRSLPTKFHRRISQKPVPKFLLSRSHLAPIFFGTGNQLGVVLSPGILHKIILRQLKTNRSDKYNSPRNPRQHHLQFAANPDKKSFAANTLCHRGKQMRLATQMLIYADELCWCASLICRGSRCAAKNQSSQLQTSPLASWFDPLTTSLAPQRSFLAITQMVLARLVVFPLRRKGFGGSAVLLCFIFVLF